MTLKEVVQHRVRRKAWERAYLVKYNYVEDTSRRLQMIYGTLDYAKKAFEFGFVDSLKGYVIASLGDTIDKEMLVSEYNRYCKQCTSLLSLEDVSSTQLASIKKANKAHRKRVMKDRKKESIFPWLP